MQESSENDDVGSQPPRQYAPTPHCPYCEQQGVLSGHLFSGSQVGIEPACERENVAASAAAREKVRLMLQMVLCSSVVGPSVGR